MWQSFRNFVFIKEEGRLFDKRLFAEVDVTEGLLWWKKTARRKIVKNYVGSWFFMDTGEFCPGYDVDNLERAWFAQEKI